MSGVDELLAELEAERAAFVEVLESVDLELVTAPGVVDDWSVRDLVVHVAFWSEHATEALALAAAGRGAEFAYAKRDTDRMNADLLTESRRTSPPAAVDREDRAYEAFARSVAALEPAFLGLRLGNGDTVEEIIRYDGPDHYREHTDHLRAWFGEEEEEGAEEGTGASSHAERAN
jgi:mycothiol maleylpyruvate isomerase-like protein